jgi:hypothetical protein
LDRTFSAGIFINLECHRIPWQFDSALLINPIGDLEKLCGEKFLIQVGRAPEREIEVFGKTIGLKIAFLQARAALEKPICLQSLVAENRPQKPAEDVILLDYLRSEPDFTGKIQDFKPVDQCSTPFSSSPGSTVATLSQVLLPSERGPASRSRSIIENDRFQ